MRYIGGHVSAAGGIEQAIERVVGIGGNTVQVFSGSPRVWQRPELIKFDAAKIAAKMKEKEIASIFTHSLYLVNLASDNPELVAKSKKAIGFDLTFDAHIGGSGVVVHVGSHKGAGWEPVKEQVLRVMAEIIEAAPNNSCFLIENAAGQNGKIGGDLQEVRWLIDELKTDKVGWCFDTCHAFAAGYALGKEKPTPEEAQQALEPVERKTAAEEITDLGLWKHLRCIHVNDSRDPFASGRDRHDNIGDGLIPKEDLQYFLSLPELQDIPLILEVPGLDKDGPDAENVKRLKKLVGED